MPKLDESARGVYLITVTPFTEAGALDLESTDRLIDFYLDKGATGLTVLGVMGEAPKLHGRVAHVREARAGPVKDRVPCIAGRVAGFAAMGELAKSVVDLGAAGVMIGPAASVKTDVGGVLLRDGGQGARPRDPDLRAVARRAHADRRCCCCASSRHPRR